MASSPIIKRHIGVTLLGKLVHYFGEFITKFLCVKKKGNYLFNVICGGSPWVFRGQISLRCWRVSRLATKPAMISLIIPHIPLIGLQNPRKAYQNSVTFLPITRYSILLTWQCFFMYRLHNLTPQRKREYAILYLATRHVGRGI